MNSLRRTVVIILVAVAAVIAGTELRKFVDSLSAPAPSPAPTASVAIA